MNIKKLLENPLRVLYRFNHTKLSHLFSDKALIKLIFRARLGYGLDLNNPRTFNEKLQWLKLYNRRPEFTTMVDKYEVKSYVAKKIGEDYLIPTIGVWNSFDEIDFDKLPKKFVIKCTHDSGSVVVCKDKSVLELDKLRAFFQKSLSTDFYKRNREWPYKNVVPRILIEDFIEDDVNPELRVYKVFNFSGEPKIIQMINGDKTNHEYINYYDTEWNLLELKQNYPNGPLDERPSCLQELLILSAKLSQGMPFIRTDFYVVKGKILFSEFTFYSDAGYAEFEPKEWDEILGDWITIPN